MGQVYSLLNRQDIRISVFVVEPTENGFNVFIEYTTTKFSPVHKGSVEDGTTVAGEKDRTEKNVRIVKYSYGSMADLEKVISLLVGKLKEQSLID